jgi:sigma-E factor negative regulatory protein RseC
MGNKAVFLGYLVPFLLFIAVLILTTSMGVREWVAGVSSLGSLIPYYIILYLFRDYLNRTITFTLKYNA